MGFEWKKHLAILILSVLGAIMIMNKRKGGH